MLTPKVLVAERAIIGPNSLERPRKLPHKIFWEEAQDRSHMARWRCQATSTRHAGITRSGEQAQRCEIGRDC